MGRIFPPDYYHHHHHYTAFPLLSLSLFVLSIATTLSIVTALCGFMSSKEEDVQEGVEKDGDKNNGDKNDGGDTLTSPPSNNSEDEEAAEDEETSPPLPPPPAMRSASYHHRSSSQVSLMGPPAKKKLASSMSMKVAGLGSSQAPKKDDIFAGAGEKKRDKKLKHEDSIWTKTIILGEKNKVRNDSQEEIVYDEDGNRITPYHPKTSTAPPPMSRQSSAVDEGAIPR
ncbi:PREDICTED: uncharacterized protein LOC109190921 [Ipomoea nil]|uniref:uncharacterized protein LOC109190921 n=1 Tax=Ipomoea nil TaxID=35883 RepID=UPI000901195B|nr:PREDICTED: uncharacterized protein LOC109190921 [Ipomoea nil]